MELIIARHGETEWNVKEIVRGTTELGMSPRGVEQASLLALYLSRKPLTAVYCSPLGRAVRTAEMIAGYHNLPVKPLPQLNDIYYGRWQGESLQNIQARFPDLYHQWMTEPHRVNIPEWEGLRRVRTRVVSAIKTITGQNTEGRVIIVSHRATNQVLVCALLGLDNSSFWNFKFDLCATTTFHHETEYNRWVLAEHNNTSYLK